VRGVHVHPQCDEKKSIDNAQLKLLPTSTSINLR